jgi:CPA1 family monovalent cation:H+ antiporter
MPWAIAIALGAIVAPPDAAAVTAVMRQVEVPDRLIKILEGESLLNDASALIVYRIAIAATASGDISARIVVPTFILVVVGSLAAGAACGWVFRTISHGIRFVPNAIIAQFAATFGVWMSAEAAGLSGILTIVAYGITIAHVKGADMPARVRVPAFAVWDTAVFILNAFAFVLIGMQLRPIWERLDAPLRREYVVVSLAVLITVITMRFAWVMTYNAFRRYRIARHGFHPPRPMPRPTVRGGIVISWAGMRGIVTLATAFAIPGQLPDHSAFPYRDLILLTGYCVVLGTLLIQGLTLGPLIAWMHFPGDDPIALEVKWARVQAYRAARKAIESDASKPAAMIRAEYSFLIDLTEGKSWSGHYHDLPGNAARRTAIAAARAQVRELRRNRAIGDDAYHVLEAEFDWADMSAGAGV